MKREPNAASVYARLCLVGALVASFGGQCFGDPVLRAADRLVQQQLPAGDWGEAGFAGEAAAGLIRAFELVGDPMYLAAAEAAGDFMLQDAGYNANNGRYVFPPFPGETYAIARLSEVSSDQTKWNDATRDLFRQIAQQSGGTNAYIDDVFSAHQGILSSGIYDVSRLAVAADIVNGNDSAVYRTRLIAGLGDVDDAVDGSEASAFALGIATWGLATTGPLDQTALSGTSAVLNGRTLSELPGLLAGLQNPGGNFPWYFDGTFPGFSEATTSAALGLMASQDRNPGLYNFAAAIGGAREVVGQGIGPDGRAYFEIGVATPGTDSHYLAGEAIEMLPEPAGISVLTAAFLGLISRRNRPLCVRENP